jgi:hypothetical protein
MGADFLAEIEPAALRERVREAVYQACSEVIATNPQLAPAAYLHRTRMSLAAGNEDAGVLDLQAGVASGDGPVVYGAPKARRKESGPRRNVSFSFSAPR